ncbi:uncharacterized protein LOC122510386 [Leptopilina heterotoma]|uniref:uncharacterized protein LOC122510386 n=1 Tax=Leptopilina heterotoma TaxID=63436 RepID=UPI001CA7FF8D|nr:uncharacterized protein LOC122510386 [Leptopilina heterotoma]
MQQNQNTTITSFYQKSNTLHNVGVENICSGNLMKKCTAWDNQNYNTTKLKLIYNCIKEEARNNKEALTNESCVKLGKILLINEAIKCQNFPSNSENIQEPIAFLGVLDTIKRELDEKTKLAIKSFIEAKLRERIFNFTSRYSELGGKIKETSKNRETVNSKVNSQNNELILLNWSKKIDEIHLTYKKSLHNFFELLTTWGECKIALSESRFKSTESSLIQAQLVETQTIISKLSCHLRLFLETPSTIKSFRILKTTLDNKLNEIDDEIQRKLAKQKEYDDLKCTEYDDILKKYIDICNAVKKRSLILDRL